MKKILLAAFLFPCFAFAATVPIPEGSVKQDTCGFKDISQWKLGDIVAIKNKLAPVGKEISLGDALFYVNEAPITYSYEATSDIVIKGKPFGFLTTDGTISKARQLSPYGTFTNPETKVSYTLLVLSDNASFTFLAAARENGFLCSDRLARSKYRWNFSSDESDVYQKDPLVKREGQIPNKSNSGGDAIGITLVRMDDFSATLAIKFLVGGNVIRQNEIQLDIMSGSFQIEGLKISFEKTGKTSIKILSIEEPDEYHAWVKRVVYSQFNLSM